MTAWVVGVDLGGTNLRVAAFADLDAQVKEAHARGGAARVAPAASVRHPVGDDRGVEAILEAIAVATDEVLAKAGAGPGAEAAVGVGIAAMLSDHRGTVARSPHLDWTDVAFGPPLATRLGPRRALGVYNDVNAIAYGEYGLGAGAGAKDLLVVFVGTGIGGGVIADGRLVEGATNCAGEIGHVKVVLGPDAAPCACGGRGCVEAYVGGVYLQARARKELAAGARSSAIAFAGGDVQAVHPGHIDQAAAAGDPWAVALWSELAPLLAAALGNAVTVLNSERLVLGGGVLAGAPTLRGQAVALLDQVCPPALRRPLHVVDAALGDDAGIVGAALLAAAGVSLIRA
ncbi:MAG TPA: ROK family protein [Kofleriaceae bacterium]|nr:ROK family protein [Kofleriaceae bacterium]